MEFPANVTVFLEKINILEKESKNLCYLIIYKNYIFSDFLRIFTQTMVL
jgi:hypothetical protein